MSKHSTDKGLGPKEESASRLKNAETQPDLGGPRPPRDKDTAERLLDGLLDQPERPRILPKENTPVPPGARRDEPTVPGERQRRAKRTEQLLMVIGGIGLFAIAIVLLLAVVLPKTTPQPVSTPLPSSTTVTTATMTALPIPTLDMTALPVAPTASSSAPLVQAPTPRPSATVAAPLPTDIKTTF